VIISRGHVHPLVPSSVSVRIWIEQGTGVEVQGNSFLKVVLG